MFLYQMSGVCLQGMARCSLAPVLSLLCKTGNCKYPEPTELHSGHPSLTPTHVGTQKNKECTSEREVRAKSV